MCGLVGAAGNLLKSEKAMFNDMLAFDVVRGPHSTGVASIDVNGIGDILKKAVLPHDLFQHRDYAKLVAKGSPQVLIGHNRWATQGKVNNINAHPFEIGSITGAHNGTLIDQTLLPDHHKFEVDSENIIHSLDKIGIDKTLEKTYGAFALTFYDYVDNTLHMVRNKERPLFWAKTTDQKCMFWASEEWMLLAAAYRNGVKLGKVRNLPELKLHSFEMPNQRYFNLDEPKVRKVKEHTPVKKPVTTQCTKQQGSGGGTITKSANHTNLVAKKGNVHTLSPNLYQTSLIGNRVTFAIDDYDNLALYGMSDEGLNVTIKQKDMIDTQEAMLAHTGIFEGNVFSVYCGKWNHKAGCYLGGYVVIDPSTIKYLDDATSDAVLEWTGPGGKAINEQSWNEMTKHGCAWCSANFYINSDVNWYHESPLCDKCHDMIGNYGDDK